MKVKSLKTTGLILFTVLLAGCASVKKEKLTFNGMIYNDNNEAVSDVSIFLNDKEISVSDIYGHFTMTGLKNNSDYKLTAVKKGYETTEIEFTFLNASQVLYLHMYSADELLAKAEKLISEKKYAEAEKTLARAESADASYLSLTYLKAVLCYSRKDFDNALSLLQEIIEKEYAESYVYLFMADVYEYGFKNIDKTKNCLGKFLEYEYSAEVTERLNELNR